MPRPSLGHRAGAKRFRRRFGVVIWSNAVNEKPTATARKRTAKRSNYFRLLINEMEIGADAYAAS